MAPLIKCLPLFLPSPWTCKGQAGPPGAAPKPPMARTLMVSCELTALRGEGQGLLKNTGAWALQPETLI